MPHLHYRIPKVYPIPPTIPYNGVTYNALQILFPVSRFYSGNFSLAPTGAFCAIVVYKIPSQVPTLLGTVTVIFMTVGEPDFYTPSQFHQPTCFWKLLKWGGKLVYYTPSPCKIFTQPSTILSSVVWVSALYIESLKYHQELRLLIWYFSGNCLIFCQFYTVLGEQNYPILCGLCKTGRTPCQTRVRPSTACHYQISPIRGRCPD